MCPLANIMQQSASTDPAHTLNSEPRLGVAWVASYGKFLWLPNLILIREETYPQLTAPSKRGATPISPGYSLVAQW